MTVKTANAIWFLQAILPLQSKVLLGFSLFALIFSSCLVFSLNYNEIPRDDASAKFNRIKARWNLNPFKLHP
jgi:hypothetical protein